MKFRSFGLSVVTALTLAACATGNSGIDVKRFHLDQPITRGTIALVPGDPAQGGDLEYRTYAASVADALRGVGFEPVPMTSGPAYVATLRIGQNVQVGPPKPSPFSVGIGGASFGRHGGIGGGVEVPVGKSGKRDAVEIDSMALQIKRQGDQALVWEGSATTAIDTRAKQSSLANAVPAMARALLTGFPGPSGVTQHYPNK